MNIDEKQRLRLYKDTSIISEEILKCCLQKPEAIVLCGGYGRDEGAWFIDSKGEISPYNDYDIAVISSTPLSHWDTNILRTNLAKRIGIRWVDIDFYSPQYLSRLESSIHNVDLIYASKVIWGKENWPEYCKNINPKEIGCSDIVKLYFTRMWTFLGSFEGKFHDMGIEESRFFYNQMAKSVLAACDMYLVSKNKYTPSYRKRAQIFIEDHVDKKNEVELVRWAINEKLYPSSKECSAMESIILYEKAYSFFVDSFRMALNEDSTQYLDPDRLEKKEKRNLSYLLHSLYGKVIGNNYFSKSVDIKLAQNYIFRAYDCNNEFNEAYLNKSVVYLRKWDIETESTDWYKLKKVVSQVRNSL